MASTYSPYDAFAMVKDYIKGMPIEEVTPNILDNINKIMWMAAPWRWTIGTLSNISLASNTTDYTQAPPSDFLYLLHSYISDGSGATKHLQVLPALPTTIVVTGVPDFISYQGSNIFRVSPNPGNLTSAAIPAPAAKQIVSFYKKQAPQITNANLSTAGVLLFDDEWFHVYEAGVLWMAYLYADDNRAGTTNIDQKGNITYSGQKALFEASLQQMREREPMPQFAPIASPELKDDRK